jgi:hypothetical protein
VAGVLLTAAGGGTAAESLILDTGDCSDSLPLQCTTFAPRIIAIPMVFFNPECCTMAWDAYCVPRPSSGATACASETNTELDEPRERAEGHLPRSIILGSSGPSMEMISSGLIRNGANSSSLFT